MRKSFLGVDRYDTKFENDASILHQPNIIKPLHGMNPRTILGQGWWDRTRKVAYASTNFHCLACGIHKLDALFHRWLEGHEDYTIDFEKYEYRLNRIVPLCHACHNVIHDGRLQILHDRGEISDDKFHRIMSHGDVILKTNGLCPRNMAWWKDEDVFHKFFPENNGTWKLWHIVIEGKKYFSKFEDFDAWREFYS